MGSAEDPSGGTGGGRWWEDPSLAPEQLREHADTWSLAADAGTATLLQNISQRLVARTHDVEGALKKVLEEADRVTATISNTNNAFHMLANTQFIENRTYQDDADVQTKEKTEIQPKQPLSEEEVLGQCKSAISAGLTLLDNEYERHEIQDSDSDDEDSGSSPLPVYAIIDSYECHSLPHIIGSSAFMEDDRIGLQDWSSEENTKTSLSPEASDSDDELESEDDMKNKNNNAIPTSSSRMIDDGSDSDWSDDDKPQVKTENKVEKQELRETSASEEEDSDEEFFKPIAKTEPISNGPSLAADLNRKFAIKQPTNNMKNNVDDDDDSDDEEGDLFGRNPPALPVSNTTTINNNDDLFTGPQIKPQSQKVSTTSVENVRAMPDPKIGHRLPGMTTTAQPQKPTRDLFASDSDDGDLFGSVTTQNKVSTVPPSLGSANSQTTTTSVAKPVEGKTKPVQGKARGLFSSSDDDDDQGILTSSIKSSRGNSVHKIVNETEVENKKEETLEAPKAKPGPKLPTGAVSIFGSAITAAIRRPSSDSDADNDDEGWGSRKSSVSRRKSSVSLNRPQSVIATSTTTNKGAGGLFDDEEDDDLFGAVSKNKAAETSKDVKIDKPDIPKVSQNIVQKTAAPVHTNPKSSGLFSDEDDDLFGSIDVKKGPSKDPILTKVNTSKSQKSEDTSVKPKSSGIFSDEDDDIFGGKSKVDKKAVISTSSTKVSKPTSDAKLKSSVATEKISQPVTKSSIFSDSDDDGLFGPPSIKKEETFGQERPSSITIAPTVTSVNKGLFSSPSDDDELFAPPPLPETSEVKLPDKIQAPPASNPQPIGKTTEKSNDLFGSESHEDDLFQVSKPSAVNSQQSDTSSSSVPQKVLPDDGKKGGIFSDDDLLFTKTSTNIPDKKELNPPASTNSNIFSSGEDDDDIFASSLVKKTEKTETQNKKQNKKIEKEEKLFETPGDDDIFSVVANQGSNIPEQADSKINNGDTNKINNDNTEKEPSSPPPINTQRKKPPIGGVSLFGSSELLAKVSQRKGQVDSDNEDIGHKDQKEDTKDENRNNTEEAVEGKSKKSSVDGISIFGDAVSDIKKKTEETTDKSVNKELIKDDNEILKEKHEDSQPVKPRKKPPLGGVAMFGGNELFSKIKQRKKTLKEDSSEEEESSEKEERNKNADKRNSDASEVSTSDSSNRLSAESAVFSTPVSPLTPQSPGPPLFPPSRTPSLGGEEKGVNLDEPITKNTLLSLNKSRSRGSIKRRPPSRKHRQASASSSDNVDGTNHSINQLGTDQVEQEKSTPIAPVLLISEPTPPLSSTNTTNVLNIPESNDISESRSKVKKVLKLDDDDGDLFSNPKHPKSTNDESLKEKDESSKTKKPPVGGVSMFGGSELLAKINQRKKTLSADDIHEENKADNNNKKDPDSVTSSPNTEKATVTEKDIDLIFSKQDSDDANDEDDIFGSNISNKSKNIKDDIFSTNEKLESNDIVSTVNKDETKTSISNTSKRELKSVIKDNSDDDLFSKPRSSSSLSKSSKTNAPILFGDDDSDDDLFAVPKAKSKIPKTTSSNVKSSSSVSLFNSTLPSKSKGASSLFADDDDGDIFSSSSTKDTVGNSNHSGSVKSARSESASSGSSGGANVKKANLQASTGPFEDPLMGPL